MIRTVFIAASLGSLLGMAGADSPPRASQHFDFDDDVVESEIGGPSEAFVSSTARVIRHSLIHTRAHFIPEILRSADSL